MKFRIIFLCLFSSAVLSSEIDDRLNQFITRFNLRPIHKIEDKNPGLTALGEMLFADKVLSLSGEISCQTCHHPDFGTGDGLPVSIGTGGRGIGTNRKIHHGQIIARNSPSLFNKGHRFTTRFFWDSRVQYNSRSEEYTFPNQEEITGHAEWYKIQDTIDSPLALQALFPMTSADEMTGEGFEELNELSIWQRILERVLRIDTYAKQLKKIYPNDEINIGHIGNALAQFQRIKFQAYNTPYDKYLRGNKNALSIEEKKGFLVYATKARCIRCHFGPMLSNQVSHNVLVPPLGPGKDGRGHDQGRFEWQKIDSFQYKFLTPQLRNISKTAPYFHNGSKLTLEEVVDHYNNPTQSLENYFPNELNKIFGKNFGENLTSVKHPYRVFRIKRTRSPQMGNGLNLTEEEKKNLVLFLKKSLTDS